MDTPKTNSEVYKYKMKYDKRPLFTPEVLNLIPASDSRTPELDACSTPSADLNVPTALVSKVPFY